MGLVYARLVLTGPTGQRRGIRMLVDSGAVWSLLPSKDWRALGLESQRKHEFALADGTVIERGVSDCRFRYQGIEAPSPVILGEDGDVALLGSVTLESMGLVLNPFDRSLQPMRLWLLQMRPTQSSPPA